MIEEVTYYKSNLTGKSYPTKRLACLDELTTWLHDTGHVNQASAEKLAEHIATNPQGFLMLVRNLNNTTVVDKPSPSQGD